MHVSGGITDVLSVDSRPSIELQIHFKRIAIAKTNNAIEYFIIALSFIAQSYIEFDPNLVYF